MKQLYRRLGVTFAISSFLVVVFFTVSLYERNRTENGHYLSQLLDSVESNIRREWQEQEERMDMLEEEYLGRAYIADYILSSDSQMISESGLDILRELMDIRGIALYSDSGEILMQAGDLCASDSSTPPVPVDGSRQIEVDRPGFSEHPAYFYITVSSQAKWYDAVRIDVDTSHIQLMSRQEMIDRTLRRATTEYDTSIIAIEKEGGAVIGITQNNDQSFEISGIEDKETLLEFLDSADSEQPVLKKINGMFQRLTVREMEEVYIVAYSSMGGIFRHMLWTFLQGLIGIGTVSALTLVTVYYHIKRMESQLLIARTEADYDKLTGLNNRSGFEKKVEEFLRREKPEGVLLLFDLDNFKRINDREGHPEGDRILKRFAECLNAGFRKTDFTGRLGGDEFIVLISNPIPEEILKEKLTAVLAYVRTVLGTYYEKYETSVSIGAVPVDGTIRSYGGLYQCADTALYIAKYLGKDRYYINDRKISCMKQECIRCRKDCPRSRVLNLKNRENHDE